MEPNINGTKKNQLRSILHTDWFFSITIGMSAEISRSAGTEAASARANRQAGLVQRREQTAAIMRMLQMASRTPRLTNMGRYSLGSLNTSARNSIKSCMSS
jgi:hypothetical protein